MRPHSTMHSSFICTKYIIYDISSSLISVTKRSANKLKLPTWTIRAELYTDDLKIDSQLLVFENHASGFEN